MFLFEDTQLIQCFFLDDRNSRQEAVGFGHGEGVDKSDPPPS